MQYYEIPGYKSAFWMARREKRLIALFRRMAKDVPAYKDFLKKNRIDPSKVSTLADLAIVPPVNKANYLRAYPLEKLSWDGTLSRKQVFTVTSGSTGAPFYFPRTDNVNAQSATLHKMFLDYAPGHRRESTLVVIGFGMGAWIGGVLTYQAFKNIADGAGYPISIFTPGANKKEIIEGVRALAPKFDHLILCGYPPFVKDVIDAGKENGINWGKFDMRIVFAAEAFSEEFREHIMKAARIKDVYRGAANVYGSADLGTMAMETPISIALRREAIGRRGLYKDLFKEATRLPTLAQFNPDFVNFESVEGEILCSGDSAVPLMRYAIGDHGEVVGFGDAMRMAKEAGVDVMKKARAAGIAGTVRELPFVSVYERSDLSTKLYGAIIYPEHVKRAMLRGPVARYVTGRFTMATRSSKDHRQYLEINVELRRGAKSGKALERLVADAVVRNLLRYNEEYAYLSGLMPDRVVPRIHLWENGYAEYFGPAGKQKWVEASNAKPAKSYARIA